MTPASPQTRVRDVLLGLAAGGAATALSLELAESLAERGRFDSADVLWRYLVAFQAQSCDAGPVGARVLKQVGRGVGTGDAIARVRLQGTVLHADAGPALRAGALATAAFLSDEALEEVAAAEAALTNTHPLPIEAARVVAALLRHLIRGKPWNEAVELARERRSPELQWALQIGRHTTLESERSVLALLRTAVYFVDQSADLASAARTCRSFTHDSSWHTALVFVLGCARFGWCDALPLPDGARVDAIADTLGAGWPS